MERSKGRGGVHVVQHSRTAPRSNQAIPVGTTRRETRASKNHFKKNLLARGLCRVKSTGGVQPGSANEFEKYSGHREIHRGKIPVPGRTTVNVDQNETQRANSQRPQDGWMELNPTGSLAKRGSIGQELKFRKEPLELNQQ